MSLPRFKAAMPDDPVLQKLMKIPAATLHEAMQRRNELPSSIKPLHPGMRICGRACTVVTPARSNLAIHKAIYVAKPGEVLVVQTDEFFNAGYWGEIMNTAAIVRQLGGLVIDAGVRDVDTLKEQRFPVFARTISLRGTEKFHGGSINTTLSFQGTQVHAGDYIVGDADGVVIVPSGDAGSVIELAEAREAKEARVIEEIVAGRSTLEIYGF